MGGVFKGVSHVSDSLPCDQLESNLIDFFNWGFLSIGGFFNVRLSSPDASLRDSEDTRYAQGQAWEPFHGNLIWETGIPYSIQPISISGVYVDGMFHSSSETGVYAHYVDYIHGRVIFDNPITPATGVALEYSYRYFDFESSDAAWFRQVMFDSYRVDQSQFLQYGSGVWATLSQNKVELPVVVVEVVPRRTFVPYQIGGGQILHQDVLFHVFTENGWDRKTLLDVITLQNEHTIKGFDKNALADANKFAFTDTGALATGALTYPDLIGNFPWKNIIFKKMISQETIGVPPLFQAVIRGTFEMIFGEI